MSQYKSAIRAQPPTDPLENSKYRSQARQLQELFPTWSNDDLQSLLFEVGGDVELAATRISDGVAEQWGEVLRKKDKKIPTSPLTSKDSFSSRGDSRGGRGGRGGRSGTGRGGASVRGRGGPSRGGASGHFSRTESPRPSSAAPVNGTNSNAAEVATKGGNTEDPSKAPAMAHDQDNGVTPSTSVWTDVSSSQPETSTSTTSVSATGSAWGGTSTAPPWGGDTDVNGLNSSVNAYAPIPSKQSVKTPATSKLSWAQIARPHEKPTPPPVLQPPVPAAPASLAIDSSVPIPAQHTQATQEEPTTAQAPSWEEEPSTKTALTAETWRPTEEVEESNPEVSEQPASECNDEDAGSEPSVHAPEVVREVVKLEIKEVSPTPVHATPALPSQVTATPSPKLATRPAVVSHRSSSRYKVTDQPVVMPSSFGTGIEKVGMQFGSLNLGGESFNEPSLSDVEAPSAAPEPTSPKVQAKPQYEQPAALHPPATTPATSTSLSSVFQHQQQPISQQAQHQPTPAQSLPSHHAIPTSVSQPIQSTPTSVHTTAATSPIQQYTHQQAVPQQQQQQPSLSNNHQQHLPHLQHLPQQVQQSHLHHSYAQHGLPTHIDPSQQVPTSGQQQTVQSSAHSNYFRQSEASTTPYFHAPTPPAGQVQDNPYGSFGQLTGQAQHQQTSHSGGFTSADYGYADNQRGFYETYAQQNAFASRNVLGHEDVKAIQGSQQTPSTTSLAPSTTQTSQQHAAAPATGPTQQPGGQGPQQGYAPPPPVPYYYSHPYPQNQYFGGPYSSGYGVPQPFVKYPAMFQPGPPGPGSASPATKQPGNNVTVGVGLQQQTNPYNQALYQQVGYDDYQGHPHHSQHQQQHQHSHSLGLGQGSVGVGSGDYGKQLYGGSGQGGIQGFIGLSSQTSGGVSGPTSASGGPRGGGSPETPYKPYAAKDVGSNRGASVQQQGQPQGQNQGQGGQGGPQGQGFYAANRFGSGVGGGVGGGGGGGVGGPPQNNHHQQAGPQAHLGYPQGGNEGNFYSYQPRQQQGYWQ